MRLFSLNIELETINCPLCGSQKHEKFLTTFDRFNLNTELDFQIVACLTCDFKFLNPRPKPEVISRFYESEGYQPFLSTQSRLNLSDRIYRLVRKAAIIGKRSSIEKLKSRGKLLDVGCGTGEFLDEMQKHGWQVEGIEKDTEAAEFARRKYSLNIHTTSLGECNFPEKSFDVITMWHVLEHLYQPLESLKTVQMLSKDDGVILVATPNISSFDAGFYKTNWVALDAPRHLSHFNSESMTAFCQLAKLKVTKFGQMPLDAFYNCIMSELLIFKQNPSRKIMLPVYLWRSLIVAFFSFLISSRLRAQNNRLGSSILYFIQKQRELL